LGKHIVASWIRFANLLRSRPNATRVDQFANIARDLGVDIKTWQSYFEILKTRCLALCWNRIIDLCANASVRLRNSIFSIQDDRRALDNAYH
jgi:hypothetical protein